MNQKKKRVKLIVAYDGTNYHGWQIQPNGITIEEVLNEHLCALLGEEIRVSGASRTDSGVHARGNVAVFDTVTRMPVDKISFALNSRLPCDIRILDSCEVAADFHPRFCKSVKTYEYKIWNSRFPDPTRRLYSYFCYEKLDVARMQTAASYLVGEHDFQSFCTAKPDVTSTVRTIYALDVTADPGDAADRGRMITVRITGNGFLYNMVRIITGTLLRVGSGAIRPERVLEILEAKDRRLAWETARPEGLTLVEIKFEDETGGPSKKHLRNPAGA